MNLSATVGVGDESIHESTPVSRVGMMIDPNLIRGSESDSGLMSDLVCKSHKTKGRSPVRHQDV